MKRYQLYLNPTSVGIFDDFKEISQVGRSKLIRQLIDRVAKQFVSLYQPVKSPEKKYVLDDLAGFVDLKTSKKTNYSQHVDDIYKGKFL